MTKTKQNPFQLNQRKFTLTKTKGIANKYENISLNWSKFTKGRKIGYFCIGYQERFAYHNIIIKIIKA